jgi:phosphate-selective porin OprO/OprP
VAVVDRWRIGNFFVPFSLEQVTNDTNNIFLERSIPTQNSGIFAGDREVGMAIYGVNDAQNLTWTFGVFFDSISEALKERIDDNQGTRVSGRLTWLPYYDEPSGGRYLLHTGVGVLYTDDFDDRVRFRARPQVHEGPLLIDSGSLPANTYTTGNIELATVWGPLSVQSELFVSNVNLDSGDSANAYGAYVYGSYFLTGEHRSYERYGQHGAQFNRNTPYTNFFLVPGCFGWGGWEAKIRISYLGLNEFDSGQYNDLTVGFNWYWSDRIRVMFDWIHPVTSAETVFGATQSDLVGMRFDFNW